MHFAVKSPVSDLTAEINDRADAAQTDYVHGLSAVNGLHGD